jgi:hypothetical protein
VNHNHHPTLAQLEVRRRAAAQQLELNRLRREALLEAAPSPRRVRSFLAALARRRPLQDAA